MSNLLTVKFNRSRRQIKFLLQSLESLLTFRLLTITQTVNTNVPNDQLPYCCGKQEQRKRALALLLYVTLLSEFHVFLYIIFFIWNHLYIYINSFHSQAVTALGSITSRCSGYEPTLLPQKSSQS